MTAHTPGPWMVEPISDGKTYQITDCKPDAFAVIAETPWGGQEDEANAHLIAAVPALLDLVTAALPVLRKYMSGDLNGGCLSGPDGEPDRATMDPDFEPLFAAGEAVLFDGERLLAQLGGSAS